MNPGRTDPNWPCVLIFALEIGIRTVSVVARLGTAREVTLDELRVELMFPRDDEAEAFFRQVR